MSDVDSLVEAARAARSDIESWIVLLWTWLEPRLAGLEDREVKAAQIRAAALSEVPARPDFAAELDALAGDDSLGAAARLLARLECWLQTTGPAHTLHADGVVGVDGERYVVSARHTWFAERYWASTSRAQHIPPAADYAPDMAVLAPRLVVCPVELGSIVLTTVDDHGRTEAQHQAMLRTRMHLEALRGPGGEGGPAGAFRVHLADLGPNPEAGLEASAERPVFVYGDPDSDACDDILKGVRAAIDLASADRATILLMPELALPVRTMPAVREALRAADPAPVFTVVGLRHIELDEADDDAPPLSAYANEAVVLADDGTEVLRHRKLTGFQLAVGDGDVKRTVQEDTRVGDTLAVLPTPIANIAIVTCLDSFAGSANRLRASHASLLLVPSLSPTVSPHRTSLADTVRVLSGAAFVCNRHPFESTDEGAPSFWTVALMNGCATAPRPEGGMPVRYFDMRKHCGMSSS